jgi:hypothetical protein
LWAKIKGNVSEAGHPIVIMPETNPNIGDNPGLMSGIYDFGESDFYYISNMSTSLFENKSRKFYDVLLSYPNNGWGELPWPAYNPYQVRGSMFKLGYGSMFTPMIPVFMAGEEFNNTYTEVPNKVGHGCYPEDNVTNWLYSSQLQWNELNDQNKKAIFDGFKKIISIRKNEPALNYFAPNLSQANVVVADSWTPSTAPAPYIRWINGTAIIIVGNPGLIPNPIPDAVCNGTWEDDVSLGGATPTQPVLESFSNRLIIAVRGMDDTTFIKEWNGTVLKDWYSLGGATLESPKLIIHSDILWVYVKGLDNFVYKKYYINEGNWSSWESTGIQNSNFGLSGPTAVQTSDGTLYRVINYNPIYLERCSQSAANPINRNSSLEQNLMISMDIPLSKIDLEGKSFYKITDLWTNETWILNEADLYDFSATVAADNFRIFRL